MRVSKSLLKFAMNFTDQQYLESEAKTFRWEYLTRFAIDLAVAAAIGFLLLEKSFGDYNKIACLIAIVYARLSSVARIAHMQVESNSAKLDIVNRGDSAASRELWEAVWKAQNKIHSKCIMAYAFLHFALLCAAFWRIFA